jgi:iron complex outermembrane receptor protein
VTPYLNGDYGRFVGVRPAPGDVRYILDQRFQNLGSFKTSGFDLSLSYDFDTAVGGFTLRGSATNIQVYENQVARGVGFIDRLDTAGWPQSWRARAEVEWNKEAWNASLSANYVGSYENDTIPVSVGVDSFTTADLSVGYSLPTLGIVKDARLRLTVQNLFDEDPPFVEYVSSGVGLYGFDPAGASELGRVVGLGITADF